MDFVLGHPPRIQPYFGYRTHDRLMISARALRSGTANFQRGGRWQAMRTMLSQFASREEANLPVALHLTDAHQQTSEHHTVTNEEGFAHFDLPLKDWALPDHPAWEVASIRWENRLGPQSVPGHILVPGKSTQLGVISDIDDTIIETGITGSFRAIARNWRRILAELPEDRIAVPGADVFYNALGGGAVTPTVTREGAQLPAATHRPFFYVSSSPWNLFSYLVAFKQSRNLPLGPLLLRDWGFDRATLGSSSHGAHKRSAVDSILAMYPAMKFALIGDDTQGDLPAYASVVAANPSRIAAVFIRTGAGPMSDTEIAAQKTIEAAGVPLWLGDSYATGQDFLRSTGLASDGDVQHIVDTIKRG